METTNLLLNTDTDVPMTLPLATGAMQRFPESCQRSSLADSPEDEPSNQPYAREASPSSRFYDTCRSRRISESSSSDSSYSHYSQSPPATSYSNQHLDEPQFSGFYMSSGSSRRSTSSTLDSLCEPPALSDCDSMSSASSEGPMSPDGPWYHGHASSVEPPELSERQRLPPSAEGYRRSSSPGTHIRSSSSESVTSDLQESMADIDLDKHCTFSKVVVTKFSNPPRYRLKKVKFHQCPICQKSFPRPSGLRTHMNMHTNTKPYTCPYEGCDKSFSVISNAKRHYRTHLVEIPPDQMGLPSVPYTVNFSEPVIVPDSSPSAPQCQPDMYYAQASSPATSTSSLMSTPSSSSLSSMLSSSLSPSSPSSSSSPSEYATAQRHRRVGGYRSRSASVSASAGPLVAVEEGFGEPVGGGRQTQTRKHARTLRWLPVGLDSRTPWKVSSRAR